MQEEPLSIARKTLWECSFGEKKGRFEKKRGRSDAYAELKKDENSRLHKELWCRHC